MLKTKLAPNGEQIPELRITFVPWCELRDDGRYTAQVHIDLHQYLVYVEGSHTTMDLPGEFDSEQEAVAYAQALCSLYNIKDVK